MAKIKNVVPYVVGAGALITGVRFIKKQLSSEPKCITLEIPTGECNLRQESMRKPELVALEQNRNYIKLR